MAEHDVFGAGSGDGVAERSARAMSSHPVWSPLIGLLWLVSRVTSERYPNAFYRVLLKP
jgi:hypothetical protein